MKPTEPRGRKQHPRTSKRRGPARSVGAPGWDDIEAALRGLRNLNAMQLELIANVEHIGKQLRQKRG